MKIQIDVPDEVIEKIEHLIALEIAAETSLKEYLVASVIEATRCTLESCSVELPRKWPEPKIPALSKRPSDERDSEENSP